MGFTVSALTEYVDQTSEELLFTLQFKGETSKLANVQRGIKSAEALQIVTNTPVPQDGASCGFNASGDTTFTQRNLVVKSVKYQDSYCPRTLETKWTQLLLKPGQHYDESDIPKAILDDIISQINRINETGDWKGDTLTGSAFLNKYDGLIKIIAAATGTSVATAQAGPVTTSNVRALVQNVLAAIPAAQMGDPNTKILMGYDIAGMYRQKMFIDNLYHFQASADQKNIMAEGTVHEIVPLHGLDGLGSSSGASSPFVFALDPDRNLYLGVDMENEHEQAKMWVDGSDGETVKYSFRFKRGWQIAFPSEIVEYANT
jgi:hypothetical protein